MELQPLDRRNEERGQRVVLKNMAGTRDYRLPLARTRETLVVVLYD